MFIRDNFVEMAVKAAGGATYTANTLGVSGAAIHRWVAAGRVPKIQMAKRLSELSNVPVEKLRAV